MLSLRKGSLLLAGFSGLLFSQQSQPKWWDPGSVVQHQPSPRKDAAMAVNFSTGHVVLFGGTGTSGGALNDTWLWNGTDWVQQLPATSPPGMDWARMVYDSFNRRNVLVGYSDGYIRGTQTWFWDGVTWTKSAAPTPNTGTGFSLAYDEGSHDLILFGGAHSSWSWQEPSDDTWAFNGSTWDWLGGSYPPVPLGPVPAAPASSVFASPPARTHAAMSLDGARQQIVLFSGYNAALDPASSLTDTWVWTDRTTGWQQKTGDSISPSWGGYQAAPFFLGGYLLAVGSPAGTGMKMETRKWDGANWTLVDAQGPPVSDGFSISEDAIVGGVLLFGGRIGSTYSNQTWGWGQLPVLLDKAPIAKISAESTVPCTAPSGATVAFDGSESKDPDGQPIVYQWTGPLDTAFGKTASLMLPIGLSTVTLAVSDGQLAGKATAAVRVTAGVEGLESPLGQLVPEPLPAPLPTGSFQAGRTLPLKLGLTCGAWKLSSNEVQPPRLVSIQYLGNPVAGAIDAVLPASSTDSSGLFRSENTNWIYNLSTQGMAPGLYLVVIEMPDGLRYRTLISLR